MCGAKYTWMSNGILNHLNAANTRVDVIRHEYKAKLSAEQHLLTSVDYLIFMTPVDRFDELVDVAADFIRWGAGGMFL